MAAQPSQMRGDLSQHQTDEDKGNAQSQTIGSQKIRSLPCCLGVPCQGQYPTKDGTNARSPAQCKAGSDKQGSQITSTGGLSEVEALFIVEPGQSGSGYQKEPESDQYPPGCITQQLQRHPCSQHSKTSPQPNKNEREARYEGEGMKEYISAWRVRRED